MKFRQLGRFSIDSGLIREDPDRVAEMFALMRVVPIRAEHHLHSMLVEYEAISPLFDVIPEGTIPPSYNIEFGGSANRGVSVRAVRVKSDAPDQ